MSPGMNRNWFGPASAHVRSNIGGIPIPRRMFCPPPRIVSLGQRRVRNDIRAENVLTRSLTAQKRSPRALLFWALFSKDQVLCFSLISPPALKLAYTAALLYEVLR